MHGVKEVGQAEIHTGRYFCPLVLVCAVDHVISTTDRKAPVSASPEASRQITSQSTAGRRTCFRCDVGYGRLRL